MTFSKKYLLLLIFLFTISVAYASPNVNKASDWLSNYTNFDQDVETVSFSVLALSLAEKSNDAQQGAARLLDRQDPAGCWPKGNCRVKDTALATLALSHLSKPTATAKSWLLSSRLPASTTGKFWIQIAAANDGSCKVNYDGKQKFFTLKNGNIVECGNKPWIEATCIDPNILKGSIEKKVEVDCTSLQSSSIISLIFQLGDSYYILDEQHTNFAKLTIANACLGTAKSSTACDYDATLYATLAMKTAGQNLGTLTYLESNIQSNNIPGYSILYLLTKKEVYREILAQKQLASGSFTNVFQTGLSLLALAGTNQGNNASAWLETQQSEDGSFNRNIKDTSAVLYGLLFKDFTSTGESCIGQGNLCCSLCKATGDAFKGLDNTCSPSQVCCSECEAVVISTCQELGGSICNFNERCIGGSLQESKDSQFCCVSGSCKEIASTSITQLPSCNFDKICDPDETIDSCPEDCKQGSSWLTWLIIIIVLAAAGGGVFYFLKLRKAGKPPKEKEVYRPAQRPAYPVSRPVVRQPAQQLPRKRPLRSKIEKELEKSLEEAKKLLKGEKK